MSEFTTVENAYLKLNEEVNEIGDIIDKINDIKQHGMFQNENLETIEGMRNKIYSRNTECKELINTVSASYRIMYEVARKYNILFIENIVAEQRGSIRLTDVYLSLLDDEISRLKIVAPA